MEVKIQSVSFKADAKLKEFATTKINKLDTFSDSILSAEVFFKVINSSDENNKETEIKLAIPGNDLFAKKSGKSFEESIDLAVEALKSQILKNKGKQEKK